MVEKLNLVENKKRFFDIIERDISRDGIDKMVGYLMKSDFFDAPASTKFHCDFRGGLCLHSLHVYDRLIREIESEYGTVEDSPYSMETLAIVALFHDVCKIDFYEVSTRNVKDENGKWTQVPFYTINDKLPISHSFKSQYIVRSYINLSREESVAIMSHMGAFDASVKGGDFSISNAFREFPLALLLHIADIKASDFDEKRES